MVAFLLQVAILQGFFSSLIFILLKNTPYQHWYEVFFPSSYLSNIGMVYTFLLMKIFLSASSACFVLSLDAPGGVAAANALTRLCGALRGAKII